MKYFWSLFNIKLPIYFVYMLQQVEYDPKKFWAWRKDLIINDKVISSVMTRKKLVYTLKAKLLIFTLYFSALLLFMFNYILLSGGMPWAYNVFSLFFSSIILVEFLDLYLFTLAFVGFRLFIQPKNKRLLKEATEIFAKSRATKIAVLGSYGKTTMKDILATVLSEGKKVATTPGNMNVTSSHARFAKKLTGDEDIIIVEFGEGEPGDIARMAQMLKPDYAIITGLAPNHLDHYSDLTAVASDLLDIYKYVDSKNVFVSGESKMFRDYMPKDALQYSADKVLDWKTKCIGETIEGIEFSLINGSKSIKVSSKLLGRHQVAVLSCVAVLSEKLGLSIKEIESGLSKTKPYDHRMQPRLVQGAWLIDDTYNGNLEGLQAGLRLLSELVAKRKWYVTPGLVDQGSETQNVHTELGKSIAQANPDIVVLMENSVRPIIEKSMKANGFTGELRIESNPLDFYTSIEHLVAVGDLVLMQNDWTDNYN